MGIDHDANPGSAGHGTSTTFGDTGGIGGAGGFPPPIRPIVDAAMKGTLEIVAGQLGGWGNRDGIGTSARLGTARSVTFDPIRRSLFEISEGTVRRLDIATAAVTTIHQSPSNSVVYQGGYLFVYQFNESVLLKISPITGMTIATIGLPESNVAPNGTQIGMCLVGRPDGEALFNPCGRTLTRIDSKTGAISTIPYSGDAPGGYNVPAAMPAADSILLSDYTDDQFRLLRINPQTGSVTVVLAYSNNLPGINLIDPDGTFFLRAGKMVMIAGGDPPSFTTSFELNQLARDDNGNLYMFQSEEVLRWDPSLPAPVLWAGLGEARGKQAPTEGLGESSALPGSPLNISVMGETAYVTYTSGAPSIIDFASNKISTLPPAYGDVAAILPAPGGDFYVAARSSCAVSRMSADGGTLMKLLAENDYCLYKPSGGKPWNGFVNWVTLGLASSENDLYLAANGRPLARIPLNANPPSTASLPFSGKPPTGVAIGSDGQLYVAVADEKRIYRVDPAVGGGVPIAEGGTSIVSDRNGHVYTTTKDSVLRIDIASGETIRIAGTADVDGIAIGPLPGGLNGPRGLAITDSGDLLIGNTGEKVILRARFQ